MTERKTASANGKMKGQQGKQKGQPGQTGQQGNGKGQQGQRGQRGNQGQDGQPNGQQNQPGDEPQVAGAGDSQGQPGDRQGQEGNPGQQGQGGQRRGEPSGQASGSSNINRGGGGGWYAGGGPRTADDFRRFFDQDYRRWSDALRNAESLLPEENRSRGRIGDVRTAIDAMRRMYLRDRAVPEQGQFDQKVSEPLAQAAEALQQEIARRLNDKEFDLSGESAVPAQYADKVAEYFKALSEKK